MAKKEKAPIDYLVPPTFDADGVQATSGIGVDGKEYPDPVPMSPPVGYSTPPDLMDMIRRMVRDEQVRQIADAEGFDTFEEAEDFEVDDDEVDTLTPYEAVFLPAAERSRAPEDATSPSSKDVIPAAGGPSQKEATPSASDPKVSSENEQHSKG